MVLTSGRCVLGVQFIVTSRIRFFVSILSKRIHTICIYKMYNTKAVTKDGEEELPSNFSRKYHTIKLIQCYNIIY